MKTRAVFLDALGTTVELDAPWTHLARALGVEADAELVDAVRQEMAFYKEHAHEGTDETALADLRARCADLLSFALDREVGVQTMMDSIRFEAAPGAAAAIAGLRGRGLKLVCVSNWDISLPQVLERCGLGEHFDGVVTSAGSGARKPDPAIFTPALELAGCEPGEALHVGDTVEEDVVAAHAARIPCLLLDRDGRGDIASLAEIEEHLSA